MLNREEEDDDDEDEDDDEDWEGSVAASAEISDDDFESSSALSGDDLASRQASSALVSPAGFGIANPHDMSSSGLLPLVTSAPGLAPLAAVAGAAPASPLTPDTARPRLAPSGSHDTTPHATQQPAPAAAPSAFSPPASVALPPGAAPLAAPGSFRPPPVGQMPVLHGLTAREGQPAVSAGGGSGATEASSIEALQRQLESGATITPGPAPGPAAP